MKSKNSLSVQIKFSSVNPGPKMIFIPGGLIHMPSEGLKRVFDFYMDETPVTVAQYREAVKAGACSLPKKHELSNWYIVGREDHPINYIDWYQASAYADWAGKRLPTEKEWRWAAQGGDEKRKYPWGSAAPNEKNCGDGSDIRRHVSTTSPVGSYPKGDSKHGLKDMAGNVWEWTSTKAEFSNNLQRIVYNNQSKGVFCFGMYSTSMRNPDIVSFSRLFYKQDFAGFRCVKDAK